MLNQLADIPAGLLDCRAQDLHALLGGPTLLHLQGRRDPALFVSVLMHGNETSGWDAVRALLRKYYDGQVDERPRSLSLFIANTKAARDGVRHLEDQPDFNRVWPGSEIAPTPEHGLMQTVFDCMQQRGVFASVDVHNNTGLNPHYSCVNNLAPATLKLATLFSRIVVYFTRPVGVQSLAMSQLCPAVTLECGKAEQGLGVEHALSYLDACIHLNELPEAKVPEHDLDLFHTTATVKIKEGVRFGFNDDQLDLQLAPEIEKYNFTELAQGTCFASSNTISFEPLTVTSEDGQEVFSDYFKVEDSLIKTRRRVMPSMLTSNLEVIQQDCLCYLMERISPSALL